MKIAYLILCHVDPKHIARLVRKITDKTENMAFIHVDKKADISAFEKEMNNIKNAYVLKERISINWGGSAIEATILLLKAALAEGKYDRLILLQGLEYPIQSNKQISTFCKRYHDTEFIKAQNISDSKRISDIHKYCLYWMFDKASVNPCVKLTHLCNKKFVELGLVPHLKKNYVKDCKGNKMKIYQGCAQFGLTKEAAEYLVEFYDNNPQVNKYFKSMFAPDESYFHTIIYNSSFVNKTVDGCAVTGNNLTDFENLTYFEYPNQIRLFTEPSEFEQLRSSGLLFFRKASSLSNRLLDYIDMQHQEDDY